MNFKFLAEHAEALLLMLAAAVLGGVAQYLGKVNLRRGRFSVFEMAGEVVISASAGMTCGLLVLDHTSMPVALAGASIAGHMGTRFIATLERAVNAKIQAGRASADTPSEPPQPPTV